MAGLDWGICCEPKRCEGHSCFLGTQRYKGKSEVELLKDRGWGVTHKFGLSFSALENRNICLDEGQTQVYNNIIPATASHMIDRCSN